ncbi:MAG: undecaprenyldiphospho-muramoylpentapeptide beta-N-acetylglucosaminyltransferase [Thermodesulfobacteriota bacterium]|nr:undecaprenyldiphospho-muramoylpentapeptide beta-N-acetylglucosaminyltransferase [Thermodesulfobacteriota bacterium]
MNPEPINLVVTGGGTGGHLFPGIAVSEAFINRFPGSEMLFIGAGRSMDAKALSGRGLKTASISCHGLKGESGFSKIRTVLGLPFSLLQAAIIIRRFRPALVFGVGGYVTGPVVLAARLMGIATCIHEQNSIPGVANRVLGRFVDRIFVSIPGSESYFPREKTLLTGNPVRKELLADRNSKAKKGVTFLVLGGSQGARKVNELVKEALGKYKYKLPEGFSVIHQTGIHDESMVRDSYNRMGIQAKVSSFFKDMAEVYEDADFVVSRAGATTLAEIAVKKIPAILIPYPFAADGHQEKNGRYLVDGGAAVMFTEKNLNREILGKEIVSMLIDEKRRETMKAAAGKLAKPQAAETIVDNCLALLKEKRV